MAFVVRLLRLLIVPLFIGWFIRSMRRDMARSGQKFDWRRFVRSFLSGPYRAEGGQSWTTSPPGRPHKSPWEVFGLSPTASDQEIKQRYRELVSKYHPDRFSELKDKEFSELAAQKFKELQEAYQTLRRIRGF